MWMAFLFIHTIHPHNDDNNLLIVNGCLLAMNIQLQFIVYCIQCYSLWPLKWHIS